MPPIPNRRTHTPHPPRRHRPLPLRYPISIITLLALAGITLTLPAWQQQIIATILLGALIVTTIIASAYALGTLIEWISKHW